MSLARRLRILFAQLLMSLPLVHSGAAGDTIQCATDAINFSETVINRFHVYRPGQRGVDITWRDLEFMWDVAYPGGLSINAQNSLRALAATLATQPGQNPFSVGLSKMHLTYNYFNVLGPTYNATNPHDSTSMVIGHWYTTPTTTNADQSHSDVYIWHNGLNRYSSPIIEAYEDTSTGHPANLANPSQTDLQTGNSISTGGPGMGLHIDLAGSGWTHPDSINATTFVHEFQHSLNGSTAMIDEVFSAAAEAVGGKLGENTKYDVPYTWPLFALHRDVGCQTFSGDCCTNPSEAFGPNYFGRSLFTAYLAYNFRGADTSGTAAGVNDDLLRRWSRRLAIVDPTDHVQPQRSWRGLVDLMGDDSCGTCVGKNYFRAGGAPLPNYDRAQLLLHNWRVANYVDRFDLPGTERQYGFPPHFGASPGKLFRAWQNIDGCHLDDVVSVPPVVTMTNEHITREVNLRVKREFNGNWYPMLLQPTGAEYWVIRADTASLGTTPRDLVITVASDSVFRRRVFNGTTELQQDGRLIASVIGYTHRAPNAVESPQWQNPQWAQLALEPRWVDVDSLPAELVFVVPSFGLTYKAAVVVITLGDGPGRAIENTRLGYRGTEGYALPYRMSLALRGAPNDTLPNPRGLQQGASLVADYPAWSPASDEVAFYRSGTSGGDARIWRQRLDGSPAAPLASGAEQQSHPDWSPRGDWIALSQQPAAGSDADRHIWLFSPAGTPAPRELTTGAAVTDRWPAFQPNGQVVAYARMYWHFDGNVTSERWQLRRINLDGSGDMPLVYPGGGNEVRSVRWSPDGAFVYFTRNDTLYSVSRDGGAVLARPGILPKVGSFDFHASGTNRLVAVEVGNAGSLTTSPTLQTSIPFRRLVLRDSAATDTRARFYRTAAEFYHPRWSPDGQRVAYSSNQNLITDRDLFIGQVSFNRPPAFVGLTDRVVHVGQHFELTVNANDPDGESLTYEAPQAYLPSGSSFTPALRSFNWSNPGPAGSTRFLVFRALDGSGGVASQVVKLTVVDDLVDDLYAPIITDNEVWLDWTAPGDALTGHGVEYDLRYALIPLNEGTFGYGTMVTIAPPAAPGSGESATITGLNPGTVYYIALRTRFSDGLWSGLSNVLQVTTTSNGQQGGYRAREVLAPHSALRQALPAVNRPGGGEGVPSVLALEMGLSNGAPTWSTRLLAADETLALRAGDTTSVLIQSRDDSGAWYNRLRIRPDRTAWRYAVRHLGKPGRIIFLGDYAVRQAWNSVESEGSSGTARLVTAEHSRFGDVKGGFDARGVATMDMAPMDSLSLGYELVATDSETAQDWFLLVGPEGSEVATPAKAGSALGREWRQIPTRFALQQNRPNPFSGMTTVHFDLPVGTRVRLEVFDAQGRHVRTLADGDYPPGVHAAEWDHRSDGGQGLAAGIYLYRIQAGAFRDQRKMVLLGR